MLNTISSHQARISSSTWLLYTTEAPRRLYISLVRPHYRQSQSNRYLRLSRLRPYLRVCRQGQCVETWLDKDKNTSIWWSAIGRSNIIYIFLIVAWSPNSPIYRRDHPVCDFVDGQIELCHPGNLGYPQYRQHKTRECGLETDYEDVPSYLQAERVLEQMKIILDVWSHKSPSTDTVRSSRLRLIVLHSRAALTRVRLDSNARDSRLDLLEKRNFHREQMMSSVMIGQRFVSHGFDCFFILRLYWYQNIMRHRETMLIQLQQ